MPKKNFTNKVYVQIEYSWKQNLKAYEQALNYDYFRISMLLIAVANIVKPFLVNSFLTS